MGPRCVAWMGRAWRSGRAEGLLMLLQLWREVVRHPRAEGWHNLVHPWPRLHREHTLRGELEALRQGRGFHDSQPRGLDGDWRCRRCEAIRTGTCLKAEPTVLCWTQKGGRKTGGKSDSTVFQAGDLLQRHQPWLRGEPCEGRGFGS